MNEDFIKIQFDVLCSEYNKHPNYRIFINGDLITERTYKWNNTVEYVTENIVINQVDSIELLVKSIVLDGENYIKDAVDFVLSNFKVNDKPATLDRWNKLVLI